MDSVLGTSKIHAVVGSAVSPDVAVEAAVAAEEAGFDHVWVAEDYFLTGAIPLAAAILGRTKRLSLSTGVASVFSRHPSLLAMDASTIANAFPGRFRLGVSRGSLPWLRQMGLARELTSIEQFKERVTAIRRLLAGEKVTVAADHFQLNEIELAYPAPDLPIVGGFWGPKMMAAVNEVADAAVLSVMAGNEYIQTAVGALPDVDNITTFVIFNCNEDSQAARGPVRDYLAFALSLGTNLMTDSVGLTEEIDDFVRTRGIDRLSEEMPDSWIGKLAVVGTPRECADRIEELVDAGSDYIGLFPVPYSQSIALLRLAGSRLLPLFQRS